MRNLKRALSLALASIMLLGMMVTGASAASNSFTDFDQIVNQEAAEVTSGLKIFEGYTDGTFGPEKEVTRAEMAVIICKILNGANVDPANFSGLTKFTDVPSWAEGYVNYCNSMGIVVGVGDNKFDPNRTVSTVEAATMLLKALGYFVEEDQLKEDWKTVVTGRATSLKLYGDLTLAVDEPLTRDNVAELLFHTLFAQRVAYDDNRNLYVKNTDRDVVVTNGTVDRNNTLAMNTFGMWYIDGVVVANSYTRDSLSETVNNAPRTDVVFDIPAEYMGSAATHYAFEYTTGLDMIGHAARVYYSMERNAPVVYAIVDRAEKVDVITYSANTTNLANAANEAGFRRNSVLDIDNYWVNYDYEKFYASNDSKLTPTDPSNVVNGKEGAEPNLSLILISNSSDYKVDCVIVLDQYLDTVKRVTERNDDKTYDLNNANGARQNVALEEAAQGDYVIVTNIGMTGEMLVFEKPELQSASITKITGTSNPAVTKVIVADGTEYKGSPVFHHKNKDSAYNLADTTNFEQINTVGEVTLILDETGKCIGIAEAAEPAMYAYVAQYAYQNGATVGFNSEGKLLVKAYLSDGTSGVYTVNTTSSRNSNAFYNFKFGADVQEDLDTLNAKSNMLNYPVYNANDMGGTFVGANGLLRNDVAGFTHTAAADQNGIGVFKATVRTDGSIVLEMLGGDNADRANAAEARTVKGHSTLVVSATLANMAEALGNIPTNTVYMAENGYVTDGINRTTTLPNGATLYQTADTAYFYVTGHWDGTGNDALHVTARNGIKSAESFYASSSEVKHDKDDKYGDDLFMQLFTNTPAANNPGRRTVSAALVYGLRVEGDTNLYFYKQGNWHETEVAASRANDKLVDITFELYNMDGELVEHTYTNDNKHFEQTEVRDFVKDIETGWYKIGNSNLEPFSATGTVEATSDEGTRYRHTDGYVFIVDAIAHHSDYQTNIFTNVDPVGGIAENAVVVDLTGEDMFHDIASIAQADANGDTVTISYCYKTGSSDPYVAKAVFVTGYSPKGASGSGNNGQIRVAYVQSRGLVFYPTATEILDAIADNSASPERIRALGEAVKAAYEAAGFQVYVATYNDGTGYYAMMIRDTNSGWMMPQYVTNSPTGTDVNGVNYYPDRVLVNSAGNEITTGDEIDRTTAEVAEGTAAEDKGIQVKMVSQGTLYEGRKVTLNIYDGEAVLSREPVEEEGFTLDAEETYKVTINGKEVTGTTKTDAEDNVYVEVIFTLRASDVKSGVLKVTDIVVVDEPVGPGVVEPQKVTAIEITLEEPTEEEPAPVVDEPAPEPAPAEAFEFAIGETLPEPKLTSAQVEIVGYTWKLNEKIVANDSLIEAGRYGLTVSLAAKEGYTLEGVTKASLTTLSVNNETAGVGYNNKVVTYAVTVDAEGSEEEPEGETVALTLPSDWNVTWEGNETPKTSTGAAIDVPKSTDLTVTTDSVNNCYIKVGDAFVAVSDSSVTLNIAGATTVTADAYYKVSLTVTEGSKEITTGANLTVEFATGVTTVDNASYAKAGAITLTLGSEGSALVDPTQNKTVTMTVVPDGKATGDLTGGVVVIGDGETELKNTSQTVTIVAPDNNATIAMTFAVS